MVAFVIAVTLTVRSFAFMRWTHTGRVMRATAQDRDAAILMGIDTDRVYRITFALGIAAVGAAGVLVSPLYAVYPTAGLQFVLLSYVVVVLGGLGDMVGALIGSLIVAAVEVAGSYFFGTAWKEIFYFVPVHRRSSSSGRPASSASAGPRTSACDARDPARQRWGALVLFGVAAVIPIFVRDAYFLDSLVLILLWGALSAAWNVAGGYAGQVSIGHAAFFGIGAYSAALHGHSFPAVAVARHARRRRCCRSRPARAIGYLSNRLKGPYFALSTIAFSQVLLIVASRWRALHRRVGGHPRPVPPGLRHARPRATSRGSTWSWSVALLYWGIQVWLEHSRFGYRLAGVREDEDAAQALGIPARRLKVIAVTASAALTSVCGTLWAQYVGFVDPFYVFSVDLSVRFALNAIIGGIGTALGPFLGSILITSLETYLRATLSGVKSGFTGIYLIVYGSC